MKNLVIVSFPAKPETIEILKEAMRRALPDTRNYEGCISVDTYVEDSTNTIHLIEDWETLEHQESYLNWRVETGLLTDLDPLLDGGAGSIKVVICGPKNNYI
jgi:quinol monooxygenase YgiN